MTNENKLCTLGLNKRYKSQIVLNEVSVCFECGKIYGLTGKNGAGKSTFLNIMGGLVDQDAGEIFLEGEILRHSPYQKKLIGGVFDISLLIEKLTAFEYLFFLSKMYGITSNEATSRINELLAFIEINITEKKLIEQYSKGMKAKLAFATSIIHNPRYLFLDEPFDGIDEGMRNKIQQKIKTMVRDEGVLIIITSHQRDLIESFCDIILTIADGKIT